MPTPVKVTWLPLTVQMVLALVVAKVTVSPDDAVALSVAALAPNATGELGAKPVMVCEAWLMTMLAVTWLAAK